MSSYTNHRTESNELITFEMPKEKYSIFSELCETLDESAEDFIRSAIELRLQVIKRIMQSMIDN